ncbi:hypothetical protein [Streptomyces vastus]|uniref:Uncharacterized protein n=1 Tax=Streptomyces vastus TaxID=285451 RepID=A0ABP6D0R5_9ACTN
MYHFVLVAWHGQTTEGRPVDREHFFTVRVARADAIVGPMPELRSTPRQATAAANGEHARLTLGQPGMERLHTP